MLDKVVFQSLQKPQDERLKELAKNSPEELERLEKKLEQAYWVVLIKT